MKVVRLTGRFRTDKNGDILPGRIAIEIDPCEGKNILDNPRNYTWLKKTITAFRQGAGGETDGQV